MNTTTNRRAMGDDDDATFNDDAMRETATTRWVRGHYDETRRDSTRHDVTRRNYDDTTVAFVGRQEREGERLTGVGGGQT